jgi:hypothetical protein
MRTGRAIVISAVLALGAAGSILASTAVSTAAVQATTVYVQPAAASALPLIHYHT